MHSQCVIRITTETKDNATIVTIDGRLADSDLGEVRRIRKGVKGAVQLNLRGLEFWTDGGVQLLRGWLDAGAQLQDANPFLQMILRDSPA